MSEVELIQLVWESTYRCPSKCRFCYNCWKQDYEPEPEMNLEQLETVLSKFPKFKRFVISGGEPFLREDLEEIIQLAYKFTGHVTVLTSGILLDREKAKMLKRNDVFVQVPLHGLEATHNYLTGVPDGYKRAIMGLAWLKRHGVQFATTTVANSRNVDELERVFELGVALGARELQFIRFMPGGEGMQNKELKLTGKQYMKALEALNKVCRRYGIFGASGAPNVPCVHDLSHLKNIAVGACSAGDDWLALDPSGRVRICNHSPTIIGDLLEQDFDEIWEHPLLQKFRNLEIQPEECMGCQKFRECRGGCRAVAETYYGSLYAPDPLMVEK